MEHLPKPFDFLSWARAHLAPGGVLLLAVPNEWTITQYQANQLATLKNWWVHPTHLNYWSSATLYGMLGRAGFRVVDCIGTFQVEDMILKGYDYPGNEKLGDELHAKVREAELSMQREFRISAQKQGALMGQGRDLVVVCK